MKKYVVGFLFNDDMNKVALIHKNRPDWQIGKLNGIGGHVEEGEPPHSTMVREFMEETGVKINNWEYFCHLCGINGDYVVDFFYAISDKIYDVNSVTDEKVEIFDIKELNNIPVIDNLKWLIPMCLDQYFVNCSAISR